MCRHGATDENGNKIRKRTNLRKRRRLKLRATAKRCLCVVPHAVLQGVAPNGLTRTSMAAVFPKQLCRALVSDLLKQVMKQEQVPTTICWTCPKCRLGNKTDQPHSRKVGQCRYPHTTKPPTPLAPPEVPPPAPAPQPAAAPNPAPEPEEAELPPPEPEYAEDDRALVPLKEEEDQDLARLGVDNEASSIIALPDIVEPNFDLKSLP